MHGGNATDDRLDSPTSAALLRGGLIPHAYVYPRRRRATRDRLRRRHPLVHTRAARYAHLQHPASQENLSGPGGRIATPQNRRGLLGRVAHRGVQQHMAEDVARVAVDDPLLAAVARALEQTAHGRDPASLALVRPMPGGGHIPALVRLSESAQIARFPRAQAFVSSGRVGRRAQASPGTRDGPRGKTSGNAPLTWAFSGAAVLWLKPHEPAPASLAPRTTRPGKGQALSLRAHQRGRAV
jgi:hypothetical protein